MTRSPESARVVRHTWIPLLGGGGSVLLCEATPPSGFGAARGPSSAGARRVGWTRRELWRRSAERCRSRSGALLFINESGD